MLRQHPPQMTAVLSDSIQYVVNKEGRVSFEASDTSWDRIIATFDINQEFPDSRLLTLSNSFDNRTGFADAALFFITLACIPGLRLGTELPQLTGQSYDTFTELIEVVLRTDYPWPSINNIAIVTGTKQAERARVMLDTLVYSDIGASENARLDHYFNSYMPARLKTVDDKMVHDEFVRYKWLVYEKRLPAGELLRKKNFMIVSSEDMTGTNLRDSKDHDTNLKGVRNWLEGTYGLSYINIAPDSINGGRDIQVKYLSPKESAKRKHVPLAGTPEAKNSGISWGFTRDLD